MQHGPVRFNPNVGVQMQAMFCTCPSEMSFHWNPLRIT